jgi:hypothetical protein
MVLCTVYCVVLTDNVYQWVMLPSVPVSADGR